MVVHTQKITSENLEGFINNPMVLLDIKAEWCGPCKQLSPIIDEISYEVHDQGVLVGVVDADENMDFCKKNNIRNIPTILIFKNGQIVDRVAGIKSKKELLELVEKNY
jgi:thioredoxin 1